MHRYAIALPCLLVAMTVSDEALAQSVPYLSVPAEAHADFGDHNGPFGTETHFYPSSCKVAMIKKRRPQDPATMPFLRIVRFPSSLLPASGPRELRCASGNCITVATRLVDNGPWATTNVSSYQLAGGWHFPIGIGAMKSCTQNPAAPAPPGFSWLYRGGGPGSAPIPISAAAKTALVQDTNPARPIALCRVVYLGNLLVGTVEENYHPASALVWEGRQFVEKTFSTNQVCVAKAPFEHGDTSGGLRAFHNFEVLTGDLSNERLWTTLTSTSTTTPDPLILGKVGGVDVQACVIIKTWEPDNAAKDHETRRVFGYRRPGNSTCAGFTAIDPAYGGEEYTRKVRRGLTRYHPFYAGAYKHRFSLAKTK